MNDAGKQEAYFASVAADYDRLQRIVAGPAYEEGLATAVSLIPHEPTDRFRFIDLGCGTGALSRRILDQFPGATGLAIDGEQAMLDVAKAKFQAEGDGIQLLRCDLVDAALPESDLVVSSFVFHHVPPQSLGGLLLRIARALQPAGGCFILLDGMRNGSEWGKRIAQQRRKLHTAHVMKAIAAGEATKEEIDARRALKRKMKEEGKDVEYRHTGEDILKQMAAAGFNEVGVVWQRFGNAILVGHVDRK